MQQLINHTKQLLVLMLLCFTWPVFAQQSAWKQLAKFPKGNSAAVDDINGKIYIMGAGSDLFTEYDPVTDTYKELAKMPLNRHSCPSGAAVGGQFYTVGGNYGGAGFKTVHAYDPVTKTWKTVAPMPTGRYELRVCTCDNKLFTGGAYYNPKVFEIYDPVSDIWQERSGSAPPMAGQAMCSYKGKVYCFGGYYGMNDVWEYDPDNDTWERKMDMPTARSCAAAACVSGKIYVIGGTEGDVFPAPPALKVVEAYDPEENKWYTGYPDMPTARFWPGACALDSLIYVIGGFQNSMGGSPQKANEVFNPALTTGEEYTGGPINAKELFWQLQYTELEGATTPYWVCPIHAVNDSVVWSGGGEGVFLRTTNGGKNWHHKRLPDAKSSSIAAIAAINENVAYYTTVSSTSTTDSRIYKTEDGGVTWQLQYQTKKQGAWIGSIAFWDEENGIAISDAVQGAFLILSTNDGGENWIQTSAENIPPPNQGEWATFTGVGNTSLAIAHDRYAWFGTGFGEQNELPLRIFCSADRGKTWSAYETPFSTRGTTRGITSICFRDSLAGFAGLSGYTRDGNLIKTTDGGKTWTLLPAIRPYGKINTVCYIPGTDYKHIAASTSSGLLCSADGGDSWEYLDNDTFYGISFINTNCGWGTTSCGMIGKFVGDLSQCAVNVKIVSKKQPQEFLLQQNYPNPFNPSTTIEYTLPRTTFVTLKVYDLLGREIQTMVHEKQSAGAHSVVFEAKELPSTIYFYKLEGDGFCEIRKMMLIK